jgi:ecotin
MLLQKIKLSLLLLLTGLSTIAGAQQTEDLSMFPKATPGQKRIVIQLPKKNDESLYMVELIPGKNVTVDCNNYGFDGNLNEKDLEGWGYTYFIFTSEGHMMGTKIGCPGVKQTKFISAPSKKVDYNSRLPLVVYVPENFTIKYRVWSAGTVTDTKAVAIPVDKNGPLKVTDVLKKTGMTTYQYGTHTIGKFALKSSKVDLKKYEGKKVTIIGKKVPGYPLDGGPELIEVSKITEAK